MGEVMRSFSTLDDSQLLLTLEKAERKNRQSNHEDETTRQLQYFAKSLQWDSLVQKQLKCDHSYMVAEFSPAELTAEEKQRQSRAGLDEVHISRKRVFSRMIDWC